MEKKKIGAIGFANQGITSAQVVKEAERGITELGEEKTETFNITLEHSHWLSADIKPTRAQRRKTERDKKKQKK